MSITRINRYRAPSTKAVIFTGGLNTAVTDLEMKPGELSEVKNMMETDGISHGYTSVPGYEVFDGSTTLVHSGSPLTTSLPSEIPLEYLTKYTDVPELYIVSGETYLTGDIVNSSGYKFKCLQPHSSGDVGTLAPDTSPASNAYWSYISVVAGKNYYVNDRVFYHGYPYTCIANHTVAISNRPQYNPPASNAWWLCEDNSVIDKWVTTKEYLTGDIVTDPDIPSDHYIAIKESIGVYTTNTEYWKKDETTHHVGLVNTFKDVAREAFRATIKAVGQSDGCHGPIKMVYQYKDKVYAIRSALATGFDSLYVSSSSGWSLVTNSIVEGTNYSVVTGRLSRFKANEKLFFFVNGASNVVWYSDGTTGGTGTFAGAPSTGYPEKLTIYKDRLVIAYTGGHLFFTTVGMYGETTAEEKVYFNTGTYKFEEGELVTESISGNTATVVSCIVESGSFADGTANGFLLLSSITGSFNVAGTLSGSVAGAAISAAASFSISIWDSATGAGEIFIGGTIQALKETPGGVLAIFLSLGTKMLYYEGLYDSAGNPFIYRLEEFADRSTCKADTVERMFGTLLYAEDIGVTNIEASDVFGDFSSSAISKKVNKYFLENKARITCAVTQRELNQYRLFFGKEALFFTFHEGNLKGATFVEYDHNVTVASEAFNSSGVSSLYFGSSDGFIYKMDSGTSFNSGEISTYLATSFHHYGSPTRWKRFFSAVVEAVGGKDVVFRMRTGYDYGDQRMPKNVFSLTTGKGTGEPWGIATWGTSIYGSTTVERITHYIRGAGTNMRVELKTSGKYNNSFTIKNMIVTFSHLGMRL